jgi:transcriptional regulator with XRE-family HTH domain
MLLSQYLVVHGLTLREFARRCGTSPSTMLRVRDGIVVPSRRVLMSIHQETAGAVTVAEMIDLAMTQASGSPPIPNMPGSDAVAEPQTHRDRPKINETRMAAEFEQVPGNSPSISLGIRHHETIHQTPEESS